MNIFGLVSGDKISDYDMFYFVRRYSLSKADMFYMILKAEMFCIIQNMSTLVFAIQVRLKKQKNVTEPAFNHL